MLIVRARFSMIAPDLLRMPASSVRLSSRRRRPSSTSALNLAKVETGPFLYRPMIGSRFSFHSSGWLHITELLVHLLDPLLDGAKELKVVQRLSVSEGGETALGYEARLDQAEARGDIVE